MKVCIASSAGGHLKEALQLRSSYEKFRHFYILVKRYDSLWLAKRRKVYYIDDVSRDAKSFFKNFFASLKILGYERPDVVISTGAGGALPTILAAKALGVRIIFIESLARVSSLSITGKIVYNFSDLFLVQWPQLARGKAKFWGAVI